MGSQKTIDSALRQVSTVGPISPVYLVAVSLRESWCPPSRRVCRWLFRNDCVSSRPDVAWPVKTQGKARDEPATLSGETIRCQKYGTRLDPFLSDDESGRRICNASHNLHSAVVPDCPLFDCYGDHDDVDDESLLGLLSSPYYPISLIATAVALG
jgi:hypothetical protein